MGNNASEVRAATRVAPLPQGLYVLRYSDAEDRVNPPRIFIQPDPTTSHLVSMVLSPGCSDGLLDKPGSVAVLSSSGSARIFITVIVAGIGLSDNVVIGLERLDGEGDGKQGHRLPPPALQPKQLALAPAKDLPLRLSGHVERRGDVQSDVGDWLGSETEGGRIEGFALSWPGRPVGVDISYSCSILGRGRLPDVLTGGFVGTRGRALPINGISMKLIGPRAEEYDLVGEAVLNTGARVGPLRAPFDLLGPTGREYVTGLRVVIRESAAGRPVQPALGLSDRTGSSSAPETQTSPERVGRPAADAPKPLAAQTRVFRSARQRSLRAQ